jgi:hypothetical protein
MSAPAPLLLLKWELLGRALALPSLSAGDVAVLWQLANRYNEKAGAAWPSLSRLAGDTGRKRNTVLRSIGRLKRAGLVVVVSAGTRTTSTRYRPAFGVATPTMPPGSHAEGARGSHAEGAEVATPAWPESIYEPGHGFIEGESGAAASAALARAAAAPLPECVDRQAWQELIDAWRDGLDCGKLLAQATRYAKDGRTKDEISAGIRSLAVNAHHKHLTLPAKAKPINGHPAANSKRAGKHVFVPEVFGDKDYTLTEGAP